MQVGFMHKIIQANKVFVLDVNIGYYVSEVRHLQSSRFLAWLFAEHLANTAKKGHFWKHHTQTPKENIYGEGDCPI